MDRKLVEGWNLKRLAWAYGCAPKDSVEESQLEEALILRVLEDPHVRAKVEQDPEGPSSHNLEKVRP